MISLHFITEAEVGTSGGWKGGEQATGISSLRLPQSALCSSRTSWHSHSPRARTPPTLEGVRLSPDGKSFVLGESGRPFRVWGVNYDHDSHGHGRLLEDYWENEWETVRGDFQEMKELGANVVRIHLQTGKFMSAPDTPNEKSLAQLRRLLALAEETGLYLDITGLGCYHKADTPPWYDAMDEAARWDVQARFWSAVAKTCRDSRAVFCYDLMNEPVISGKKEDGWLAGELGGKYFVQRLTLEPGKRTPDRDRQGVGGQADRRDPRGGSRRI